MHEAVIVSAVRTAVGKAPNGTLRGTRPDDLASTVIAEAMRRAPGIEPADIDDVILGCAMPEAEQGLNVARIARYISFIPSVYFFPASFHHAGGASASVNCLTSESGDTSAAFGSCLAISPPASSIRPKPSAARSVAAAPMPGVRSCEIASFAVSFGSNPRRLRWCAATSASDGTTRSRPNPSIASAVSCRVT